MIRLTGFRLARRRRWAGLGWQGQWDDVWILRLAAPEGWPIQPGRGVDQGQAKGQGQKEDQKNRLEGVALSLREARFDLSKFVVVHGQSRCNV